MTINNVLFLVPEKKFIPLAEYELSKLETYNDNIKVISEGDYNPDNFSGWIVINDIKCKLNALIIDMAGNLKRHGGIDSPYTGKQGKKQEATNEKVCPNCESLIPSHHKECPECGYEFIVEHKEIEHETKEDKESSLIDKAIQAKWYEVDFCQFSQHYGKSGKFSLRVDFYCGYDRFSKWLVPLHESQFAANKARFVLDKMNPKLDYSCNDYEILAEQLSEDHQTPISIYVDTSGKYADILQYEWYTEPVDEMEIIEELDDNIPF